MNFSTISLNYDQSDFSFILSQGHIVTLIDYFGKVYRRLHFELSGNQTYVDVDTKLQAAVDFFLGEDSVLKQLHTPLKKIFEDFKPEVAYLATFCAVIICCNY